MFQNFESANHTLVRGSAIHLYSYKIKPLHVPVNTFDCTMYLCHLKTNLFLQKPDKFISFFSQKIRDKPFKNSFSIKSLMDMMRTTCQLNAQGNYLMPSQVHMITKYRLRMPTMELLPLTCHMLSWDEKVER